MRLPTALASLYATVLLTAPSTTAQSNAAANPNNAYTPPILSAAGNRTGLPGGNALCGLQRVRNPWHALTSDAQELYLEATQMAIADGGYADFAAIVADSLGQAQGEASCALFSWHRRLLLAYESYLRDLDERFVCLTLPYYDVHTAYIQTVNGQCSNMFECSSIFGGIGGAPDTTDERTLTYNDVNSTGYAVTGTPYVDSCATTCDYVVRDNIMSKTVPSAASFTAFQSLVATAGDYATFLQGIQYGLHNEVLDAIGGTLATAAAAHDALYYSWYASLDMYLVVYHMCRIGVSLTYAEIRKSLEAYSNATQTCGGISGVDAASTLLMRIAVDGELVDVSQHPRLGVYFSNVGSASWNYADTQQLGDNSYTYVLPESLRQQILSNNDICTGFNRAFAATYTPLNTSAITNTMRTRTVNRTTTTTTTRIVNGTRVTTTRVNREVTRTNSTLTVTANSTLSTGQLASRYTYRYLGNFNTADVAFGEGTFVSNGYTGYTPFNSNGAITTKHNGIVSANYSRSSIMNKSNVVINVRVGTNFVARNITASVATSGTYWAWLQAAYDGLYTRFEGNMNLVATHMKLLECYTFDNVYGLSNLTSIFMTNKNLVTNRVECGQRLDLVRSGLLQLAVRSTAYTAESLRFANPNVIRTIRTSYRRVITREVTYIRRPYIQSMQSNLSTTTTPIATPPATPPTITTSDITPGVTTSTTTSTTPNVMPEATTTPIAMPEATTSTTTTSTSRPEATTSVTTTPDATPVATTSATTTTDATPVATTPATTTPIAMPVATTSTTTTSTSRPEATTSVTTTPDATPVATTSATTTSDATPVATTPATTTPDATPVATTPATTTSDATPVATTSVTTTPDATPVATTPATTTTDATPVATTPATTTPIAMPVATTSTTTTSTSRPEATTSVTTTPDATPVANTPATTSIGRPEATTSMMTPHVMQGATTSTMTTPYAIQGATAPATTTPIAMPVATTYVTTILIAMPEATTSTMTTPYVTPEATPPLYKTSIAMPEVTAPTDATPCATPVATTSTTTTTYAAPGVTLPTNMTHIATLESTTLPTTYATPDATTPNAHMSWATTMQPDTFVNVSVEYDATYCIQGPICSGFGNSPDGSLCPVKGAVAVQDCHQTLPSYTTSGICVAPKNAQCAKSKTGAWGCVFDLETTATPTTVVADAPTVASNISTSNSASVSVKPETENHTQGPTKAAEKPNSDVNTSQTKTLLPVVSNTAGLPMDAPTPCPPSTKMSLPYAANVGDNTTTGLSSYGGNNTPEQQQHASQDIASVTNTPLSRSFAASTTTASNANAQGSFSLTTLLGIVVAVSAVVALAGFAAYKIRQRSHVGDIPPSGYYTQPLTPTSQSMKL